ncbi:MAG: helix-turn-helix domain-containing protein [Alphaproteobacteria bacterium]|nr:helix-turn-helix domain-containing protein [Alphaproteobacteria bacterium]
MATSVVQKPCSRAFDRPYAELVEEVGLGVTMSVGAGRTIVIEGDPIEHVYRIVSGSVRLYKAVADGRRQIIDFLGAMDCFGLTGLDSHAYSVESITDVSMIHYPRKRLEAAIENQPDLRDQLFRLACTELDRAQQYMLLLGRKSADERVASFLLDLVTRQDDRRGDGVRLHLAMSRQDIADHLGLTIETVSRIFTRFKQAGLISLPDRHAVIVSNVVQLTRMADGGLNG